MKDFKEEILDNGEILNIVNGIVEDDKTIEDFRKDYPDKTEKLEEPLLNYLGEKDHKILRTGFPDKWKYIKEKLAYPYEYFNCFDDYQKPVDNLKEEDFLSKIKNDYPGD